MIAVDTNVLVYAHRREMPRHKTALTRLRKIAEGTEPWGLPVFCLGEFLRVVTHPRVFQPPSNLDQALAALQGIRNSPTVRILSPGARYPQLFAEAARAADARGNLGFDAQIAAVCTEHGVRLPLTMDRDFSSSRRFRWLG